MSTACIIVIGNEILSGRTQDTNTHWLAKQLNECGVRLREARVVPDDEAEIVATINACRARYDYVFTTGGIGPTHDDITAQAVARAFDLPFIRNASAVEILTRYYGAEDLNEARLGMCDMPEGATLIPNPVSAAPGFIVENVYVMAGVPRIMQAMFDHLRASLQGGSVMLSETVSTFLTEGAIAAPLAEIQARFPEIEIGSYPFMRQGRAGTSLVARHDDTEKLLAAKEAIVHMIEDLRGELCSV
jgi:molybdenum cofactor synthesis domain-containing protein